jgi:D-alanine--poly(phosphoribitol) ligase subunit 1
MIINVLEYLENSEKRVPGKIVIADEKNSITYSQLIDYAKRIGTKILNETNSAKRKPIVVFVDRNIESLVSFMGIAYSGNFYVPIDIQMPKIRVELILETLQPIAALVLGTDIEYSKSVSPHLLTIVYEVSIKHSIDNEKLLNIRNNIIDTDPLYTTFTSGSTGIPKGVITCHRSVIDMTEIKIHFILTLQSKTFILL